MAGNVGRLELWVITRARWENSVVEFSNFCILLGFGIVHRRTRDILNIGKHLVGRSKIWRVAGGRTETTEVYYMTLTQLPAEGQAVFWRVVIMRSCGK